MKTRLIFCLFLWILGVVTVANAGVFGPLEPYGKEQKPIFSLGVGYMREEIKWKEVTFFDVDTETFKTRSNQFYLEGAYRFLEGWQIFGRLGISDAKLINEDTLKDSYKLFGSVGVKGTFYSYKNFSLGAALHSSFYSTYKDSLYFPDPVPVKAEFTMKDRFDFNFGLIGQVNVNSLSIYAGPFYAYNRGKVELRETVWISGVPVSEKDSDRMRAKAPIGGLIGLSYQLSKQIKFNVEGQIRNRVSVGGLITYSF